MRRGDDSNHRLQGDDPVRLLDDPGVDPWIADLLLAREPTKVPPGLKQRMRLSLGRGTGHRAPLLLRPAVVLGVLIGCGAFASAALGPWKGWIGRTYHRLVPAPNAAVAMSEPLERSHPRRAPAPIAAAPAGPALDAPAPAPVAPSPVRPAARPSVAVHARHLTPPPATPEETQAVLAGMRALRVDRDPVRARALLSVYLDRNPSGALAEEALALSIEAAVAHHDADAKTLGARYLRRYPGGPFRALALESQR
ncbi:MAG TPA: hypothetical protein VHG72_18635 [Polyangia bacterium]|nr:hypothetical protein [Polyangia bacterium]